MQFITIISLYVLQKNVNKYQRGFCKLFKQSSQHDPQGNICLHFATIFIFFTRTQINEQFEIVLENPLENFPLQNMEIDLEGKNIFVSGKNILYRLNVKKNMSIKARQTGPEINCLEPEYEKYCGDDYNTVMVVTPDILITCGTLRGGLCSTRDKLSLNITMTARTSSNIRLVSNNQASAVGILLNIIDRSSFAKFKNIVLFAKQYTTLPIRPAQLYIAAIFSVLPDLSAINKGSSIS